MRVVIAIFFFAVTSFFPIMVKGGDGPIHSGLLSGTKEVKSFFLVEEERSQSIFYCDGGESIDLEPEEINELNDVYCVNYRDSDSGEAVSQLFQPSSPNSYNVEAEVVNGDGNVILTVYYTISYTGEQSAIRSYFENKFFVSIPFNYLGIASAQPNTNTSSDKSSPTFTVKDYADAIITFGNSQNGIDLESEVLRQVESLGLTASDDVLIYITDDNSFCTQNGGGEDELSNITRDFEDPSKLVYWYHLSHDGQPNSNGELFLNSSSEGFGSISFSPGVENYFNYHIQDVEPEDYQQYGFYSSDAHKLYVTLHQFSGTILAESRGDNDTEDDIVQANRYQCPEIANPQGVTTNYIAPSGIIVALPNSNTDNFHLPRFTTEAKKYGMFETALIGFTVTGNNGNNGGSYQGHYKDNEFKGYHLREAKYGSAVYQLPNPPPSPLALATAAYDPGFENDCESRKYTVNILPGFTPANGIDAENIGVGLFIEEFDDLGSFAGGTAPYSVASYIIRYCNANITYEQYKKVEAVLYNPSEKPTELNGVVGWQIDVYNENNKIERVYASYESFVSGDIPTAPTYHILRCNGEWEAFTPPPNNEMDFYSAILFEMSAIIHPVLDAAGLVPGLGEPADVLNGMIYEIEGDETNAVMSYAATVPFGSVATGSRLGVKVVKNGDNTKVLVKNFWIAYKKVGSDAFGKVNARKLIEEGSSFEKLSKTEGDELLNFVLKKPPGATPGSALDITWKNNLERFFNNSSHSVDELVDAWQIINKAENFKALAKNMDWVEEIAKFRKEGIKLVTGDGDLLLKNESTGKTFAKYIKDGTEDAFLEFSDDAFLAIERNSSSVSWRDATSVVTRKSDDGEVITGVIAKLTNGKFGFIEDIPVDVTAASKAFIRNRGQLRRNFDNILSSEEAHHLVSIALLKGGGANIPAVVKPLLEKAIAGGFDYNDIVANGMALSKYRKATGKGLHASHPGYTRRVAQELENRVNMAGGLDNLSPAQARGLIESVATQLRTRIQREVDLGDAGTRINMITDLF